MATRYCAPLGSGGTNSGTIGNPWLGLNHALTLIVAGDLLYVRGGTYAENVDAGNAPDGSDWTTGAVTVQNYPAETPMVQASSGAFCVRFNTGTTISYQIWTGINVDGINLTSGVDPAVYIGHDCHHIRWQSSEVKRAYWSGIECFQGPYIELLNNVIHDGGRVGPSGDAAHGIYMTGFSGNTTGADQHCLFEGNEIYGFTNFSYSSGISVYTGGSDTDSVGGTVIRKNKIHGNGTGMFIGEATTVAIQVYDNLVYDNDASGIVIYSRIAGTLVYNNTVHSNNDRGIEVGPGGNATAILIKNNAITSNSGAPVTVWNTDGSSYCTATYNCFNGNGNGNAQDDQNGLSTFSSNVTDAPGYEDEPSRDLRLADDSLLIDAGTTLATVADDYIGATRPAGGGYDIGAYEAAGAAAPGADTTTVFTFYPTARAPAFSPATLRGAWDKTSDVVTKVLSDEKANGGAIASVTGAETNAATNYDVLLYRGITSPLAAQTFGGTVNMILGILESDAAANVVYHLHLYVTEGDTDVVRGTVIGDHIEPYPGDEWSTTASGGSLSSPGTALSAVDAEDGDRLVFEIGARFVNTSTSSLSASIYYGTLVAGSPVADLADSATDVTVKNGTITFSDGIVLLDLAAVAAAESLRLAATEVARILGGAADRLKVGVSEATRVVARLKVTESERVGMGTEGSRMRVRIKGSDTLKVQAGHEGATTSVVVPGTRLQARSGIALSGATLAGWTAPHVTCAIATVDRTTAVRLESFSIMYRLDRGESECTFSVSGFQPAAGNDVKITYATPDDYLFAGTILQADVTRVQSGEGPMVWSCVARGYIWLMDRYDLVLERYDDVPVNTMVAHMLNKYTNGGFSLGYAPESLGRLSMEFTYAPLSQCIDMIAKASGVAGASWMVTPHKVVRIFEVAPGADLATITNGQAYLNLSYGEDITSARSRMIVRGTGSRAAVTVSPEDETVPVIDVAPFVPADGVVGGTVIHGQSVFNYASVSTGSGEGSLLGCNQRLADINEGDEIKLLVDQADATKQAAFAVTFGGGLSGALTYYEAADVSLADAQGRASRGLGEYGETARRFGYTSSAADRWLRVGRTVPVSVTTPMVVSGTFKVQQVVVELDGPLIPTAPRLWRHVEASSTVRSFRQALSGLLAAQQQGGTP